MPQGSVLGMLLSLLYTSEHFSVLVNKLTGCADDSTSIAVSTSPFLRDTVAESMNCDHGKVSELCDLKGMKFSNTMK